MRFIEFNSKFIGVGQIVNSTLIYTLALLAFCSATADAQGSIEGDLQTQINAKLAEIELLREQHHQEVLKAKADLAAAEERLGNLEALTTQLDAVVDNNLLLVSPLEAQDASPTSPVEANDPKNTSNPEDPPSNPTPPGPTQDEIRNWFLGAGLGVRWNLSGDRVEEISFAELADGSLLAQVNKSDEAEIRILFETHYLFDDVSFFEAKPISGTNEYKQVFGGFRNFITAAASCGFWAIHDPVPGAGDRVGRRGCGPFVAVAFDKDATPEEFALGHLVSFGAKDAERPFNLGYGIIIDPDSTTIDTSVLNPGTLTVKDEFKQNIMDGTLSLTTEEETIGALILFSTNF